MSGIFHHWRTSYTSIDFSINPHAWSATDDAKEKIKLKDHMILPVLVLISSLFISSIQFMKESLSDLISRAKIAFDKANRNLFKIISFPFYLSAQCNTNKRRTKIFLISLGIFLISAITFGSMAFLKSHREGISFGIMIVTKSRTGFPVSVDFLLSYRGVPFPVALSFMLNKFFAQ